MLLRDMTGDFVSVSHFIFSIFVFVLFLLYLYLVRVAPKETTPTFLRNKEYGLVGLLIEVVKDEVEDKIEFEVEDEEKVEVKQN